MVYIDTVLAIIAILSSVAVFIRAMNRSWLDAALMFFVYFSMCQIAVDGLDLAYIGIFVMALAAPAGRLLSRPIKEDEVFPELLKSLKSM